VLGKFKARKTAVTRCVQRIFMNFVLNYCMSFKKTFGVACEGSRSKHKQPLTNIRVVSSKPLFVMVEKR